MYATVPEDRFDRGPLSRGHLHLVADVRLDNRPELVSRIGLDKGASARLSDSAVLFEAILKWRDDAVDCLVGEYAFALWDSDKQQLTLGRDLLGLRPLHYYRSVNFFAFASMPSGLHALPEVPYASDSEFLVEQLAIIPRAGSRTCFKDVERVEPAAIATVTRHHLQSRRYWRPKGPVGSQSTPSDYEEGLRSVMDEAVSSHLRGAGEVVASQLSGGLDSSTVTATAARLFEDGRVIALTAAPRVGFDGRMPAHVIADESELAAATARIYSNIDHMIIPNSGESPLTWLDRNLLYQQQPMANLVNAVWGQAIHRYARDNGANIILKASAGNLTHSYSGLEWLPLLLAQGRIIRLMTVASRLIAKGMAPHSVAASIIGPFTPPAVWAILRRMKQSIPGVMSISAVSRAHLAQVKQKSRQRSFDLADRPRRDPFENRVWALSRADGGNAYKGVLAEWGLSVRDPTADRRVIEYSLSIPYHEFVRGGVSRSLARRAFADRLPQAVSNSRVRGQQSADWYEALNAARPQVEEEVASILACPPANEAIDIPWLTDCLATWPSDGWERDDVKSKYRLGLLRAVSAGHFIRKVSGSNQ